MGADLNGFDAGKVDPQRPLDVIPQDDYVAALTASEKKANAKRTGHYLKLTFTVLDGEYKGRKIFDQLNLWHPSAQTVAIAQSRLSAICRAVNKLQPRDSTDLHDIPLIIAVGHEKRDDNGELKNVIKAFKPKTAQQVAPAATAGAEAPWAKKGKRKSA